MFATRKLTAVPARFFSFLAGSLLGVIFIAASATTAFAQIAPAKESLSGLYPGKAYSPYAQRTLLNFDLLAVLDNLVVYSI